MDMSLTGVAKLKARTTWTYTPPYGVTTVDYTLCCTDSPTPKNI